MMQIEIGRRKIGLNFLAEGIAEVMIWAPFACKVMLIADHLPVPLDMEQLERGYWYMRTDQMKVGDSYAFEILKAGGHGKDGVSRLVRNDPAALYFRDGLGGRGTAFDPGAFEWSDRNWKGIPRKDYIVYELHVGTFSPGGDFKGIQTKLDYLVSLGITAVEIMPVAQFPGERNWGYDGVYPFAVQNSYGGPEDLQRLVDACHTRGLAVILDVVYNHMGPECNYFGDFGPYFTDKYLTPWGKAINFDDAGCDGVRNYFIENALMWFRDFHIDALRLDAVHAIKDFSAVHILIAIRSYTEQLAVKTGRQYQLFAELDLNDNRYINPVQVNGYGMDGQWVDEFHHALRVAAGQPKEGYYSDFNGVEHLAKSYAHAYVYDGQYSPHRDKTFGAPAAGNPGEQFTVFSQNHDQIGNRMLGERSSRLVSGEMLKLLAGAVFCSPFIPLIFMGEEYGEEHPFMFFISHSDPGLIEAVRKGRKAEFAAFHQSREAPDPQDEKTFISSRLDWAAVTGLKQQQLLNYYRALIVLRKTHPVLSSLDRIQLKATALPEQNCLVLKRWNDSVQVMALMNFSDSGQVFRLSPRHDWETLVDSSAEVWGGYGHTVNQVSADGSISVKAESLLILAAKHV
ncbi:malto-oligosyltrehalose trehalohydrolase [Pedobacter kyungheensis]|uniref:Malto-oligosyltrehalose trehalohydrolase n=1 Tax=Pedobacter kyungheensis TaxID=1069985 RepID=A0A0C1G8Y4_9SPHI|nr:malto-oligosyltrehalose trehalohydrolase [Pedobacter kyungheensis]KIA96564.1 malto-oligosyltrehalose trehalohydrolase [Pedobacter kyungheensis]